MTHSYTCIIVDDETHCIETLKHEIQLHCPQLNVVATTNKPTGAKELILHHSPQIVFLDIEMPGLSGFDLLASFSSSSFSVIFVTAYNQYAIQAIKFAALDYLLKPVDGTELIKAIERFENQVNKNVSEEQLSLALQILQQKKEIHKIAINNGNKIEIVKINDIIRCEADSNYCKVFLMNDKELYLSKTLKEIESTLENHQFLRVHNKHLINIDHVQNYVKSSGGTLTMSDGYEVQITKFTKKEILEKILHS